MPEAIPEPWLGIQSAPSSSLNAVVLKGVSPSSWQANVRPVFGSVNRMGSENARGVATRTGLTSSHVVWGGLVVSLNVTRRTWIGKPPPAKRILPVFQFAPMEGSPMLAAPPEGHAWLENPGVSVPGVAVALGGCFFSCALAV